MKPESRMELNFLNVIRTYFDILCFLYIDIQL